MRAIIDQLIIKEIQEHTGRRDPEKAIVNPVGVSYSLLKLD